MAAAPLIIDLDGVLRRWEPLDAVEARHGLPRGALDEVIAKLTTFQDAVGSGAIQFTGNPMRLGELMMLMDDFPRMFEIVEPKRTAVS